MHGRVKSAKNELTVVVTSDDLSYTKQDAIVDADEYAAENYPGQTWDFVDVDLDKYGNWSVRYEGDAPNPRDKRINGPDWTAT